MSLADALRAGRVTPPYSETSLQALVPTESLLELAGCLKNLNDEDMGPRQIASLLTVLAEERAATQREVDRVRAVWSPPEFDHIDARDTMAVVRDLFHDAHESVDIVTFAIDEGEKAKSLFGELAERMDTHEELRVRLFVNIHREHLDLTPASELVRTFKSRFSVAVWPGTRLPEVFYYPRSVEIDRKKRAVLHAKAIVVDHKKTLLTSANFTEAAQVRNIEAGVLIDDPAFACRMTRQLDYLVEDGVLVGLRVSQNRAQSVQG
jgi:phosphatidylserine/phosphatidylglycerophosphate/cardiolipin synthase-like enzyme